MTSDIQNYADTVFEYDRLTKIHGEPTYDSLLKIKNELKANAQTVECSAGGGQYGMLGLVLTPEEYALLSNVPFERPDHPGTFQLPQGTTQVQARALEVTFNRRLREYKECRNVEKALKKQLIQAIDNTWLAGLRNTTTNAINQDIPAILTHLFDIYGSVTSDALQTRENTVKSMDYDPAIHPVDNVFSAVQKLMEYADAARIPYTQPQIIGIAYNIFLKTGRFKEAVTEWNRIARANPNQNTWINFKIHFRRAHQELRERSDLTASETPL